MTEEIKTETNETKTETSPQGVPDAGYPGDLKELFQKNLNVEPGENDGDEKPAVDSRSDNASQPDGDEDHSADGNDGDDGEVPAGIDPKALMDAARMGLTFEQASRFGTTEALRAALEVLETRGAKTEPKDKPAEKGRADGDDDGDEKIEWTDPELDEFDPSVAKAIKSISDQAKNSIQKVLKENRELRNAIAHRDGQAQVQRVDQILGNLPEWKDVLGEGDYNDITPEQQKNRGKAWETLQQIQASGKMGGISLRKQCLNALGLEFPDRIKESATREMKNRLESARGRNKAQRPTTPMKPGPASDKEAITADMGELMGKFGFGR